MVRLLVVAAEEVGHAPDEGGVVAERPPCDPVLTRVAVAMRVA